MRDFLKKLLGKNDPEVIIISFHDIPEWLDEREKTAQATLLSKTSGPERHIRDAVTDLKDIMDTIALTEHDPEIHPRLKNIVKNSLPLFVRAMRASLARELPEDIREFYPDAVECLKGCISSALGQGKYLRVGFPEEMKAVTGKIDTIGREINRITAFLADFRKEKTLIDDAMAVHTALVDIDTDCGKAAAKYQRIAARMTEMTDRIAAIEKELNAVSAGEGITELADLTSSVQRLERERDTAAKMYASLSMTASHVLRKAEKIAVKQRSPSEISVLRRTIELLSNHTAPDAEELLGALDGACPIAERMIAQGEIVLKNKEERTIFSESRSFSKDICSCCTLLLKKEKDCHNAQENLARHPLIVKIGSLEREKSQLDAMLIKERHARAELDEWLEKTKGRIPELNDELQKKIKSMLGDDVQLQIHDQRKA